MGEDGPGSALRGERLLGRGAMMGVARRPIRGGGASNRQIDDALYWAMVRIRIANGDEETSVLGLSSTLTRLADEAEERRPIGEGWFNFPADLAETFTEKKSSSAHGGTGGGGGAGGEVKRPGINEEDDVPWWERYMKGKDELDPRGLGAFVNLFRKDKNPRRLGPLWHMYQFCIAMIPTLFIFCLANSVTGRDLSKMPEQFTSADKIAFAAMRRKEYEKECAEKGIPVPSFEKKELPWYRRF